MALVRTTSISLAQVYVRHFGAIVSTGHYQLSAQAAFWHTLQLNPLEDLRSKLGLESSSELGTDSCRGKIEISDCIRTLDDANVACLEKGPLEPERKIEAQTTSRHQP